LIEGIELSVQKEGSVSNVPPSRSSSSLIVQRASMTDKSFDVT